MHWLSTLLPRPVFEGLHALNARVFSLTLHHMRTEPLRAALRQWDLNVCKLSDFYSPLPDVERLARTRERWARPSELAGVKVDLEAFKTRLHALVSAYGEEFNRLPEWSGLNEEGFGPGFPWLDGVMVYAMVRDLKPKRYIE
ncbi:MAG: hypothetical protein GY851_06665, partial [bacterium]|nr:hypothetical protein [bacterium]